MTPERPPFAWREVGVVVAVQAAVLLAMAPFYGPHRDELYFVSAGQRLAWGYPDQPSLTPLLARLATEVAPHHLVVLRLPGLLAAVALVLLAVQFGRLLGAARAGQVLTAVVVAASAVVMALGHRLSTATFDTLAWTAVLVLATQAVLDRRPRLWLVAGVVAGVGLNNKHAVAFLLAGILLALLLDREPRPELRTPWPWLAGVIAAVLWVPNLLWQADHGWPVFDLSADIADEYGGALGRVEMLGQAALMFSPLVFVVWVVGLVRLLRTPTGAGRGCRRWSSWWSRWSSWSPAARATTWPARSSRWSPPAAPGWPPAAPPPPRRGRHRAGPVRRRRLGRPGPGASRLDVRRLVLPADRRRPAGDDRLAGVRRHRAPGRPSPPRRRGRLHRQLRRGRRLRVVRRRRAGLQRPQRLAELGAATGRRRTGRGGLYRDPSVDFTGCERVATLHNDVGIDNEEAGHGVWVCAGPIGSWSQRWSRLSHYDA